MIQGLYSKFLRKWLKRMKVEKVLVIGSGPIKIGEAAEFDYSGSQALIALKEEKIKTILLNSNIATVQTSYEIADKVYLLPVNFEYAKRIIEKERPDGIMVGFGGETALEVGVELYERGVLEKYNVKVLGTSIEGIKKALSREAFRETMVKNNIPIPRSKPAKNEEEAIEAAEEIGYPVILRASFNLGGRGSVVIEDKQKLKKEWKRTFAQSRGEVLVEEYLKNWKEVEFEVVRDSFDNCAVPACIENLDPMGVHTGDSVVVTPAQTLDNFEYQKMRSVAIEVARAINLVGECNVQFAINPKSYKFYVIETNPRMSRSSALASKATGYPLAYIAAKLALGYKLYEIKNSVSKATTAFFEPSLDYITIKIPRWDFEKFENANNELGTEMKSIGEVMGIGRNFEEALQKAIRMLDINEPGLVGGKIYNSDLTKEEIEEALKRRKPYWFLYAAKAFKEGISVRRVSELTGIDEFFLRKIEKVVKVFEDYKKSKDKKKINMLKKLGFSDEQLGISSSQPPYIKQIDTLAGEWPASTNYLYTTYNACEDDIEIKNKRKVLVIGAGCFRIGVSVEFDWCTTTLVEGLKKYFDEVAIINYNPETVSTDWYRVEKLYFDEITQETVAKLYKKEGFEYVVTFAGGQIGNNLAKKLEEKEVKILGTSGESVDIAENRKKFSKLLEKLNIKQPPWISAESKKEIEKFAKDYGFPLLLRPSYVLSGSAMKIAKNFDELYQYLKLAISISRKYPVVVSKFITNAEEAELDCASDSRKVFGISMKHIEEAGVHSGDATIVTPYFGERKVYERMKEIAVTLANELSIKGVFNIQFITKNSEPYVIELNLRASRSMPFCSKSVGYNLMELGLKGIFSNFDFGEEFFEPKHKAFGVKTPQFSWGRLRGAYPYLGPEMKSTGESAALGKTLNEALLKSWLGAFPNKIPIKGALVYGVTNKDFLKKASRNLETDVFSLEEAPIDGAAVVRKERALELINEGKIDILITDNYLKEIDYEIRRRAADLNIPLILNGRLGFSLSQAFKEKEIEILEMKEYW
jgi:carbamoyl-phosphate synthase large subunit